ncbi:MAG: HlyC/CorC family transporter [Phycisphaerales bacterium]|nr:HlyC/CorC family transporter [Phycisphaerales bacterium]
MTGLPLLVFGLLTFASALVGTMRHALTGAPRASVEDLAASRLNGKEDPRITRILNDIPAHARALALIKLALDLAAAITMTALIAGARNTGPEVAQAAGTLPNAAQPVIQPWTGWGPVTVTALDAGLALLVCGVVLWPLTVLVPMSIARHAGERVVVSMGLLIRLAERLVAPFGPIGRFVDEVVRRLAGVERVQAEDRVEAELLSVIEEGEATGALDEKARDMLEAVVQFRDLTVQQIMTPRTEVEAIQLTNDLGAVIRTIRELGHSRIPVYDESLDNILGIFYVKDLMHWLGDGPRAGKAFDLRSILRPAIFVPETKTVSQLLKELMDKKVHIALVADEYGGTSGLVTIEDIVEQVFGEIRDEYEPNNPEIPDVVLKLDRREADLDASARIDDVNDQLDALGVQLPVSEAYDTVGGFITTHLGRIPARGEKFSHENMTFTIVEAKPTRVVKVNLLVSAQVSTPQDSVAES